MSIQEEKKNIIIENEKGFISNTTKTSMSVKLTKSPAEQQSHNHGIQLNANKPLSHNCRVKDRETLGAIQSCKHKSLDVTCHKFSVFANISIFEKNTKIKPHCTTPIIFFACAKGKSKSLEGLRRYRPYKLMNIASP